MKPSVWNPPFLFLFPFIIKYHMQVQACYCFLFAALVSGGNLTGNAQGGDWSLLYISSQAETPANPKHSHNVAAMYCQCWSVLGTAEFLNVLNGHHRVLTLTPLKVFVVKGKDRRNDSLLFLIQNLGQKCMQLWMEINVVTLHKVVETMPQQISSIIKAKGECSTDSVLDGQCIVPDKSLVAYPFCRNNC